MGKTTPPKACSRKFAKLYENIANCFLTSDKSIDANSVHAQ